MEQEVGQESMHVVNHTENQRDDKYKKQGSANEERFSRVPDRSVS